MYRKLSLLSLSIVAVLFHNCTTNTIDEGDIADLPPIIETVTYEGDVQAIIIANCVNCHSGPNANAGLQLTSYVNVRAAAEQGNLLNRVNNAANPMPQTGLLPPEIRQIIDQWVIDGYLQN